MSLQKTNERQQEIPNQPAKQDQPRKFEQSASQRLRVQSFRQMLERKTTRLPANLSKHALRAAHKQGRAKPSQSETSWINLQEKPEYLSHKDTSITNHYPNHPDLKLQSEKLIEKDTNNLSHAYVANGKADDINHLIKKMTLTFATKNNEANFSIANGVFKGAQFALVADNKDLSVNVSEASVCAKTLLLQNELVLKNLLREQEINLRDLTFMS